MVGKALPLLLLGAGALVIAGGKKKRRKKKRCPDIVNVRLGSEHWDTMTWESGAESFEAKVFKPIKEQVAQGNKDLWSLTGYVFRMVMPPECTRMDKGTKVVVKSFKEDGTLENKVEFETAPHFFLFLGDNLAEDLRQLRLISDEDVNAAWIQFENWWKDTMGDEPMPTLN